MQQISFYQTTKLQLMKTISQLVQKCYDNNLKVVVSVPDQDMAEEINKMLWTFSQKIFLPHGSNLDELPEKQPIFITPLEENPASANTVILVDRADFMSNFEKCLILFTDECENLASIQQKIKDLKNSGCNFNNYRQTQSNSWEKVA